jgi:hypothetical protein
VPIVFVHGVAQRNDDAFNGIVKFLRHYVAPAVWPDDPDAVQCYSAYWGDLAATFAWDGASRPRTALTGQGVANSVAQPALLDLVPEPGHEPSAPLQARRPGLVGGAREAVAPDLQGLAPSTRSDLLSDALLSAAARSTADPTRDVYDVLDPELAAKIIALDDAASMRTDAVEDVLAEAAARTAGLPRGQGSGPGVFGTLQDRIEEALSRTSDSAVFVASRLLEEIRRPINDAVTRFMGDVFTYLVNRTAPGEGAQLGLAAKRPGVQPGAIPLAVLGVLKRAVDERRDPAEPLVVLSHSMGGQIVYDIVTSFLPMLVASEPADYGNIRIDVWGAAASQVGLFEEMKIFLASKAAYSAASGRMAPFPDPRFLGTWWNVWDRNDFLSFTAKPIFEGVVDHEFVSGRSLVDAHGGYLIRPSFFRSFAEVISRRTR